MRHASYNITTCSSDIYDNNFQELNRFDERLANTINGMLLSVRQEQLSINHVKDALMGVTTSLNNIQNKLGFDNRAKILILSADVHLDQLLDIFGKISDALHNPQGRHCTIQFCEYNTLPSSEGTDIILTITKVQFKLYNEALIRCIPANTTHVSILHNGVLSYISSTALVLPSGLRLEIEDLKNTSIVNKNLRPLTGTTWSSEARFR